MSARKERLLTGRTNSARNSLPPSARSITSRSFPSARSSISSSSDCHEDDARSHSALDTSRSKGFSGVDIAYFSAAIANNEQPNTQPPQTQYQEAAKSSRSSSSSNDGLPPSFWDIPSEEWVEAYRNRRLKHPKQFAPEALQFTKPQVSMKAPLRSLYLDPSVNTAPQAHTQTELHRIIRERNMAHMTYDIDGDGVVDQDDYKVAKKMDVNGIGVLKPEEVLVGKRVLAERFFRTHKGNLHLFNEIYCQRPERDNVRNLATSNAFPEIYAKVKLRHQALRDRGSKQIMSCMALANPEPCKWNYYVDKADATAWNDWGALPRKVMYRNPGEHDGSRQKLVQSRRITMRDYAQKRLDNHYDEDPMAMFSTRRIDLITNNKYLNAYI